MRLTFTKRAGKYDDLVIERPAAAPEAIRCPKQGIVPHDMVHFAVKSVVAQRGFLSMVCDGAHAAFTTQGGEGEEAVERLVEAFQAELWGGRVPASHLVATYEHACHSRDHAVVAVTEREIDAIRERLDTLTDRWSALAVGEALVLKL